MAIFLTILKIIGIVLLCLIALVLFVAAIILFVPVRYRAIASKKTPTDDLKAKARVSFLFHIISAGVSYDNKPDHYIKVFGFRIRRKDSNKPNADQLPDTGSDVKDDAQKEDDQKDFPLPEDEITIDWNGEDKEDPEPVPMPDHTEYNEKDLFDRLCELIESVLSRYDALSEKYESFSKKIRFWDKMAHDERNLAAVDLIKAVTIRLLKKIAPKKIKGFVHFGFEDPATTGLILVYLSILYTTIPRGLKIDPGFYDTDIYGQLDIKGNIKVITVALAALKIYINKDCRRMWRLYKKHSNK